jgi:hypothetical protein
MCERGYEEAYSIVRSHLRHIQAGQPVPFGRLGSRPAGT